MEVKTYDTILTMLCDDFDSLIAPRTIVRANTNVIYLIFKAIAKGFELINNVCVVLSNKFNPLYCSEDDLDSTAAITGTERLKGSATGLHIIATNNGDSEVTLLRGLYFYALDENTKFEFEILENTVIEVGNRVSFIAMSVSIGKYPVSAQLEITVTSELPISPDIVFSCADNTALQGTLDETYLEFRERLNNKTDRQNSFIELEEELRNLPYLFDCKLKFNANDTTIQYDGYDIPPFTLAIFYSGAVKSEIAAKIGTKILCPTVKTSDSIEVFLEDDVFVGGKYGFNLIPFGKTPYTVELIYRVNIDYVNEYEVQNEIRKALFNNFVTEKHIDYIKEDDFYNAVESLNISGIDLLAVNLKVSGSPVNYVTVPTSRVPELRDITFISVD